MRDNKGFYAYINKLNESYICIELLPCLSIENDKLWFEISVSWLIFHCGFMMIKETK